ncbi:MAG: lipoate--protein ligase family protein [Propionibacteriaceae bacterium]|nr:lipoate--protein ligase family protein [Propionibacteriaceae bacterium]
MIEVRDESAVPPTAAWRAPVLARPSGPLVPSIHAHTSLATAAFSRRDSHRPGYPAAVEAARALGFASAIRTVGGHLAPLHEGTLIIDVVAAADEPHTRNRDRFRQASAAICRALNSLGVPAQVGELPGEYCPGEFSVNAAGETKLAGIAQRVTPWGFLVSINLVVDDPEPLRAVVEACYRQLGLTVDPSRVGAVSDHLPGVRARDIAYLMIAELAAGLLPDDVHAR